MTPTAFGDDRRIRLHRRVRIIVAVTITWNLVEAIVAISAGVAASSAALIGFGLDSVIEVASAAAIAWQFTRKDPKRWEKVTVRAIGIVFFALAPRSLSTRSSASPGRSRSNTARSGSGSPLPA
jgi:hypothetical protein